MKDDKSLYIGAYILHKNARTEKHIRQIKKANIDFMVSVDYNDKSLLDLFEKHSLGAVVSGVFPSWWGADGEKSGQMHLVNPIEIYEKCIENYSPHSAIWGVDIGDEISSADFSYVNTVYEKRKDFFSDKIMYTNLYPNYGVRITASEEERKKQWGTHDYKEYIEKYCREVSLPYICFDHYPYCHDDMHKFVENLACVKEMADKYEKSIYLVAQSSSYDKNSYLTIEMLRTQCYIAIAFGVKVIMWACYSAGWWHNHILDENGNKTKLYRDVKKVNGEIKKFFKYFSQYKCENIKTDEESSCIVCELKHLKSDKKALYVVSFGSSQNEDNFTFRSEGKPKIYCADKKCKIKYNKQSDTYSLDVLPGCGVIIENAIL